MRTTNVKPIDRRRFAHLYPFKSHWIELAGNAYHYLDEGRGKPVVMVHGNPTWSFYFRNLVKGLAPIRRTIVPDHMGCGLSGRPNEKAYDYTLLSRVKDLEALMRHLKLYSDITLVVHDWGGAIGMLFALRNPRAVSRFVITNTAAFFPPGEKILPMRLRLIRNIPLLAKVTVLGLNLFSLGAAFMAPSKPLTRSVRSGLTAPYNSWHNRLATLKFVEDIPLHPKDPSYQLIKWLDQNLFKLSHLPALLLWGEGDFVFTSDYLKEWQKRFPQAETHRFAHAGHYLLEDEPDSVLELVKTFIDSHP